jgi:DNA-binding transcriptional ArsR family regulator
MDLFSALADPRRRKIVELIADKGEMTSGEICKSFDITPQAVSQHLNLLRESGILRMQKLAQKHIYSINPEPILELDRWARETTKLWDARFASLEKVLKDEKNKNAKKMILWQRNSKAKRN